MKRRQIELSLELEKRLAEAAEHIKQAIIRPHAIKQRINSLRRGWRKIAPIPDEVKEWFEETEDNEDE